VDELNELKIPLDAKLGDVQAEVRGTDRIPIHGGKGQEGVFNVVDTVDLKPQAGWTKVQHGASWIFTVEFTDKGPISQGLLTYGETLNPTSSHYSDQAHLYSQKGWDDLLFTDEAVEKGTLSRKSLTE